MSTTAVKGGFTTAAATINDASNYVLVDTIVVPSSLWGASIQLDFLVGSRGALSALKLTWAAIPGGTHSQMFAGTDFNTANSVIEYISGSNVHQSAANARFQMRMTSAPPEIAVYAKKNSADTTLQVSGAFLRAQ